VCSVHLTRDKREAASLVAARQRVGVGTTRAQGARTEPEKKSTVRGGNPYRVQAPMAGASSQDTVRRDEAVSECEYDNEHSTHQSESISGAFSLQVLGQSEVVAPTSEHMR
jgi:hypothetical protein